MFFLKHLLLLSTTLLLSFQNCWAMEPDEPQLGQTHASPNTQNDPVTPDEAEQVPSEKKDVFHSREFYTLEDGINLGGLQLVHGPKPREGGLGPDLTVEVSPWVKSVKWIRNMKEGERLEIVFDPDVPAVYVGVNLQKVQGHKQIVLRGAISNPHGGSITKKGDYFRTDEDSGHFGANWNDEIRFEFIHLMYFKGLKVLHEPWVRDSVVKERAPLIWEKKMGQKKSFTNEDYEDLKQISEKSIFSKFSNDQLAVYQNNFLRKFGNSIFNPSCMVAIFTTPWSNPPSKTLYEQDSKDPLLFKLKQEFQGKGKLDIKFYSPEHGFSDPEELEKSLYEYFKDKVEPKPLDQSITPPSGQ